MKLTLPWMVGAVVGVLMIVGESGVAQEMYPFFRGIRQEGMGGAGINVVDDETALFINPAGLGKIRGPYFIPISLQLEANLPTEQAIQQNTGYANLINNPQNFLNLAQQSPNTHMHAEAQTLPAFVTTNFGIGLYAKYQLDGQLNTATNIFQLDYFNDYAAVIGYCLRLFSGRLKIGVSGKVVDRVYFSGNVPGNATNLDLHTMAQEGTGAGLDTSVMLSAPWVWLPSITAVVHDVGGTNFTMGNGIFYQTAQRPPPQQQSLDVGFGLFPILGKRARMTLTAEYRDTLNAYKYSADAWRPFHAGGEINFNDIFFIRGGMNEHYWTAGLEIDFGPSQLQLASYGEEVGILPYQTEDRRYVFMYGFRF